MKSFAKFKKILFGLGAFGGATTLYYINNKPDGNRAYASWTTNYTPSQYAKWDDNWDHRSPKFSVHPKKISDEKGDNEINEVLELAKPTATRHLILIRHGQYNLDGKSDGERILTKLGRDQADCTGKRLKAIGLPYTDMVKSTMARAQETGSIISKSLPEIPVKECNLIREGAPIPPEPPIGHWKPEVHVSDAQSKAEPAVALQFPPEAWLRLGLNHASITWISITPNGRVVLQTLGDSGHIPANMVTSR